MEDTSVRRQCILRGRKVSRGGAQFSGGTHIDDGVDTTCDFIAKAKSLILSQLKKYFGSNSVRPLRS